MEIVEKKYKNWSIFYSSLSNDLFEEKLGEKIIDTDYNIVKILKDTKRNYVAVVMIDSIKYVLKEFRSEIIIPQRKIQTFFKEGEAVTTLKNGISAINDGIIELVKPIVAIVKRRKLIEKSYLLIEYIEGEKIQTKEDVDKILLLTEKIHKLGRYHGDLNTSNFIRENNTIRILDTQMKKEKKFFYKRAYDILTLEEDILVSKYLFYNVRSSYKYLKKDIGYFLAVFIKYLKKTKIISKIKSYKKKLRKKGWKI
ncbi:lipopolysaccharide core heptose(II) kinase RfaY [Fusobacterium sp.]|uniref:lipopolysaccharide core heptose(II) kinase RfaY n=1 Tax=Fusobacterium sp. TaxID=68766 RepID=UPI002636F252|nr:lipopolysaccharide core heptose(II) kinase RfaY [Fusobacterium sp.]